MERDPKDYASLRLKRGFRRRQPSLDSEERSDKAKLTDLVEEYDLEIPDRGVGGIWNEECDENLVSRAHCVACDEPVPAYAWPVTTYLPC